jgi:lysozyme
MNRFAVAGLSLSAAALVSMAVHEGFRGDAYMPTKEDTLTIGFGTTKNVKAGEKITVERALIRLLFDVHSFEVDLRNCIGNVPLYQHEWDAFVSWAYNVGTSAACKSTLVKKLKNNPPDYVGACKELLRWDKQAGKRLTGLTKRRKDEYMRCMGAQ